MAPGGQPYRTDEGHLILDCAFGAIDRPAELEQAIGQTIGVVESGLFIGMASVALVAGDKDIAELRPR